MKNRSIEIINLHKRLKFRESEIKNMFIKLDEINDFVNFDQIIRPNDFVNFDKKVFIKEGDLSIAFLTGNKLSRMHKMFLNDSSPTDVITFQGDDFMKSAGEICVSVDYALKNSLNSNLNFHIELTLYLVHGWLHLAGFKDDTESNSLIMRSLEKITLTYLETKNYLPKFYIE